MAKKNKSFIKLDTHSMKNLCNTCTTKICCTGNHVAPPILYLADIARLTNAGYASFALTNIIKEQTVLTLKKKQNSSNCMFFDETTNQCTVYDNRPFDCKMFPFDLYWDENDNEIYWIVYSCNKNSDWSWTEQHLKNFENDPQFNEILSNVEIIKSVTNTIEDKFGVDEPPFVKIRKVKNSHIRNPQIDHENR